MTEAERTTLLKRISFAIGLCGSVRPERMAEAVMNEIERYYKLTKE